MTNDVTCSRKVEIMTPIRLEPNLKNSWSCYWHGFIYTSPRGRGVTPLTFEDTRPGYTLPAPSLAGSPCNHWYNLYIAKRLFNAFRITGVTFEVSSCTRFPPQTLQHSTRPPSWWGGARCPLPVGPWDSSDRLWLTPPHVTSWIKPWLLSYNR